MPTAGEEKDRLIAIPGTVPNLLDMPPGCRFAPRCQERIEHELDICTKREPDLIDRSSEHQVRCFLYQSYGEHRAPLGEGSRQEETP